MAGQVIRFSSIHNNCRARAFFTLRGAAGSVLMRWHSRCFFGDLSHSKLIRKNPVEVVYHPIQVCRKGRLRIAVAEKHLRSNGSRRLDFLCRIGNKQKLVWRTRRRSRDFLVARPVRFGSHARVKESIYVRSQIACIRSAKQKLLRQDASRRIDADSLSLPPPSFESDWHIGKNFTAQFPTRISLLPDFPLKCFQRRAFAVSGDQPLCIRSARMQPRFFRIVQPTRRLKASAQVRVVLRMEILNQGLNLGILCVLLKKRFQLAARIGEKRFIDKINRCRRTLDIEKNDADLRCLNLKHAGYFAAVCGGIYRGPKQTGS